MTGAFFQEGQKVNLVDVAVLGFLAFGGVVSGIALKEVEDQPRTGAALLWLGIASGTAAVTLFAVSL